MTIAELQAWGANTEEGLSRCMGMEAMYLRLVGMMKDDHHDEALRAALDRGDLKAAFEEAHALKGVLANLALTPAQEPISELTEILRAGNRPEEALVEQGLARMAELKKLVEA